MVWTAMSLEMKSAALIPSFLIASEFTVLDCSQFCCGAGGSAGYQAVITNILPVIATALEDEMPEVRHSLHN